MSAGRNEKVTPGKAARKLLAQGFHKGVRGGFSLPEGHQHVGVKDADRSCVLIGQIDAARGQADVVDDALDPIRRDDRTDFFLDLVVGDPRRLLDSRACLRSQVESSSRRSRSRGKSLVPGEATRPSDKREKATKPPAKAQRCWQSASRKKSKG